MKDRKKIIKIIRNINVWFETELPYLSVSISRSLLLVGARWLDAVAYFNFGDLAMRDGVTMSPSLCDITEMMKKKKLNQV